MYATNHSDEFTIANDGGIARADCPPSLSKSCSDKIALKQCTSLLSSTSILIAPENAYLHSLVIPVSQYVESACNRAFGSGGRMKSVADGYWAGGYSFHPFNIMTTSTEFAFSRRAIDATEKAPKNSNISAVWTPGLKETIINGILQGRKQADLRGSSAISRMKTFKALSDLCKILPMPRDIQSMSISTYSHFKGMALLSQRQTVKDDVRQNALRGWVRNAGDDFELNI